MGLRGRSTGHSSPSRRVQEPSCDKHRVRSQPLRHKYCYVSISVPGVSSARGVASRSLTLYLPVNDITVFWVVTPYSFADGHQRSELLGVSYSGRAGFESLSGHLVVITKGSRSFPQFLQANAWIVP
jgi:hypothetical protein